MNNDAPLNYMRRKQLRHRRIEIANIREELL